MRLMRLAVIAIPLLLAACTGSPDTSDSTLATDTLARRDSARASSSQDTLTAYGWGPLRIGMTRAEVVAAAGPDANPNAVGGPEPESCDQFRPRSAPAGLLVMVERDTLTRISLSRSVAVVTDAGFAVGDSAAAVERHYGNRAVSTPHKYQSAPARYVTVWIRGRPPASSARGIVYEIGGDDRIMHIHAGGPSIQYVEGCL
jgi:hypothetical protein